MTVQIRKLQADDRPLIKGVLGSDETFRDDEVDVALELVDDALGNAQSDYWFRIAEVEGEIAGYLCYGPTPMTDGTFDLYWSPIYGKVSFKNIACAIIPLSQEITGSALPRTMLV